MDHLPWIEKYRPGKLSEVKGHSDIITVLEKYGGISSMPHLLFYGPPGSGKTSTILAMARDFYGENVQSMVMEINASYDRGMDTITGKIKEFVETSSLTGKGVKLIILDEADALTAEAQSALRRIIEKHTKHARFCICCNYCNKISVPIQSRCTRLRFSGIDKNSLREKILEIKTKEKVLIDDSAIESIIDLSNGDARRVINILQTTHMRKTLITSDSVYKAEGRPLPSDMDIIFRSLMENSFKDSFRILREITRDNNYSITDIVTELSKMLFDNQRLMKIMDELSNIEYNLAEGGSEVLAIGHLVSCFH